MNKLLVLSAAVLCLVGCTKEVEPPTPTQVIANSLTKSGMHVADVTLLAAVPYYGSEVQTNVPVDLCLSAGNSASFRGTSQDGKTVIGVACLEKDGYLNIALERTYQ